MVQTFNNKNGMKAVIRRWCVKLKLVEPQHDGPSPLSIGSFGSFTIAYRKGTADEAVLGDSFENDIFFTRVPEYKPEDGDVIIDVGAHIGTFSLLAASKARQCKVYAIEACKDSFNLLWINVALNHYPDISIHHLALAESNGSCTLYHDAGNWGHSTVNKFSDSGETVESCTLSRFLEINQIEKCQFMKMNCEGAEFPVLLSTPTTVLQRFKTILVLYHCDLWGLNTEKDLINHLKSGGFHVVIRHRTRKRGWLIATKV